MSAGEVPNIPQGEARIDPIADIRSRCFDEVNRELDSIWGRLSKGKIEESDATIAGSILLDMVKDAAEAENLPEVEANIGKLIDLHDRTSTMTDACMIAIGTSSQNAFNILGNILETEKTQGLEESAYWGAEKPAGRYIITDVLSRVIQISEDRGVPPNNWIDTYAINEDHRWELYVQHFHRQARKGDAQSDGYQLQLEHKIAELLDETKVSSTAAFYKIANTIELVSDPDLRHKLASRFMDSSEVLLTEETFYCLIEFGSGILKSPNLTASDMETVTIIADAIESDAAAMQEVGIDPFYLIRYQLPWKMRLKQFNGGLPHEIVAELDHQIGKMLSLNIPDYWVSGNGARNRESVSRKRDDLLQGYVDEYVKKGDFGAARTFLNSIFNEAARDFAMQNCLKRTRNINEINVLKPEEMTLAINPELELQFDFAEMRVAEDLAAMQELAVNFAATINQGNKFIKHDYIADSYQLIAACDEAYALSMAQRVLGILRNVGVPYRHLVKLSEAVIHGGDLDESRRAFEDINASSTPSYQRLEYLWKLGRTLNEVYSNEA